MANKNSTVKLVMIGEGEEKENLYRLAEDLGITDMVYFAGFQDNPYRFIAGAQIFVLSSFYEGFPNSLLEAMACGTAVIAADCQSGPAEIIEHEKNGLLVPVGDKKALAEAINRLISDSALAGELSKQASEDILRYDISVIAESYLELFKKMSR